MYKVDLFLNGDDTAYLLKIFEDETQLIEFQQFPLEYKHDYATMNLEIFNGWNSITINNNFEIELEIFKRDTVKSKLNAIEKNFYSPDGKLQNLAKFIVRLRLLNVF